MRLLVLRFYRTNIKPWIDLALAWIWGERRHGPPWLQPAAKVLRLLLIMGHGFIHDRLAVHAQALTTVTLLSILPFVAVVLMLVHMSGFIGVKELEASITKNLPEFKSIVGQVFALLENTDFQKLGLAGVAVLLGAIISMMSKVERALNDIWAVRKQRFLWRKFIDYSGLLIITSGLALCAFALQIFSSELLSSYFPFDLLGNNPAIYKFMSIVFMGLVFSLAMHFLPNCPVPWRSSALGGFMAGFFYYLLSYAFFGLQIGMAKYNLIYSSLAALPVTIIWISISWMVFLLCAEFAYVFAHFSTFRRQVLGGIISSEFLEESALKVALALAVDYKDSSEKPLDADALSRRLRLPLRFIQEVMGKLLDHGILEDADPSGYVLAGKGASGIRLRDVVLAVRRSGERLSGMKPTNLDQYVGSYMGDSEHLLGNYDFNLTLAAAVELIKKADARP